MKRFGLSIFVLVITVMITSCSGYRLRTGNTGKSSSEIGAQLQSLGEALVQSNSADSNSFTKISNMLGVPGTTVYYSEGPSQLGTIEEVMPLSIIAIMQDLGRAVTGSIQKARIYYIHQATPSGFQGGLVIHGQDQTQDVNQNEFAVVMINDASTQDAYVGMPIQPGYVSEGAFEMSLNHGSSDSTIVVLSNDMDPSGEDLAETIQLKVFLRSRKTGDLQLLGKINTLESF